VTSRPDFHPESKVKTIPFRKIVGVLPDNGKKMVDVNKCSHTFKFILVEENSKETALYAKSKAEAEVWMQIFCRIIDLNNGEREPVNTLYSAAYESLLKHQFGD
jgi:hypothetical protein